VSAPIEALLRAPQRFQHFQAVRLLELWLRRQGRADAAPGELVRFRHSTALRFAGCELESIAVEPRDLPLEAQALERGDLRELQLAPTFLGLLGAAGALPVHYTERVAQHAAATRDHGPRAFLDLFSNRSLALFYEGWRKYRMELEGRGSRRDALEDRFLPLLLALAGVGHPALRARLQEVPGEAVGHFAQALRQRPASSVQIGRVLGAYFDAPVKVEQFVGHWYAVPPEQQTKLGEWHSVLGAGAMVGERVWQRDLRMRIVIGPLDHAAFDGFLPGGAKARALREWLALFTGVTLEYVVQLVLRARDVVGVTLGADAGARLGWDSFLAPPADGPDRADVCYEVMTTD
jgi:type VI secretion system protein ImpH